MILCINIGNSNISVGICNVLDASDAPWKGRWRLSTNVYRTVDEYLLTILACLQQVDVHAQNLEGIALASVVPSLTTTFSTLAQSLIGRDPFLLSSRNALGLDFGIDSQNEMGADLIANAVAAYDISTKTQRKNEDGRAVIVVDFGTALTFTMLSASARVLGVSIAPGVRAALRSLTSDTAQLPNVELNPPPFVIGTNTTHSIQSGVVFGFTGLVESMVARIQKELTEEACVIATGGMHSVFASCTNIFDYVRPWLALDGIRMLYARSAAASRPN